jgi:hypothetical protein
MADVSIFGPVDSVLAAELGVGDVVVIEAVVLVLVLANFVTRKLAHDRHLRQAEQGAEAISRFLPHEVLNVLLVLGAFYYMTVDHHPGMVLSVLALGLFIADFFEFESRKVEARRDIPLERPKGSIVAGVLVLSYAGYKALFFLVEGPVSAII